MFIHRYSHKLFVFVTLLFMTSSSFSDAYKWVDADGGINYSQQQPVYIASELIKAPPPPSIDPIVAQKEIDILIEKQDGTFEENEQERQRIADEEAEQQKRAEYCRANQHNLQLFQNNTNDRLIDADGNVTRLTEEKRQQTITEIQQNIAKHCQ